MPHPDLEILPHGAGINSRELRSNFVVEPDFSSVSPAPSQPQERERNCSRPSLRVPCRRKRERCLESSIIARSWASSAQRRLRPSAVWEPSVNVKIGKNPRFAKTIDRPPFCRTSLWTSRRAAPHPTLLRGRWCGNRPRPTCRALPRRTFASAATGRDTLRLCRLWRTTAGMIWCPRTEPSPAATSPSIRRATFISAPAAKSSRNTTALSPAARRADEGRDDDLLCAQAGLRGLRAQAQVLPECSCAQNRALVHEAARDKARAIAKNEAYAVSRRERKKVEMLFAHLKRILRLDRLRLRGPSGAKDEFLLAAPPKLYANWRSSSPSRRRPSPCEAESRRFASLTAAVLGYRPRPKTRFFNEIDVKPTLRIRRNTPFSFMRSSRVGVWAIYARIRCEIPRLKVVATQ